MITEFRAWANNPDAFLAWLVCEAVGWAGDPPA
jgi:hypothetical protein